MINVGVLGSGKSAINFIKALNTFPNLKLVEIGSRNKFSANKISKIYKSKIFIKSIDDVIYSKKNSLVIICLPPFLQPKIIEKLISTKKNIICEKPLSVNYLDTKKIVSLWKKKKQIFLINLCYNFFLPFNIFLNEIKSNKLQIKKIEISWRVLSNYSQFKGYWKNDNSLTGGVLFNYGSHLLNLFFPKKKN